MSEKSMPMDPPARMTCELQVDTQSPGWHKTMTKVLKGVKGLSFTIDASRGIARVSGQIDPGKLMILLAKTGKHASLLWVDSGNHYKNMTAGQGNEQNVQDGSNRYTPMMCGNGHGYGYGCGYGQYPDYPYGAYGRMGYHLEDPRSEYCHPRYQHYSQYYPPYPHYI